MMRLFELHWTVTMLEVVGHRWVSQLTNNTFDVKYCPQLNNHNADLLPKLPAAVPGSVQAAGLPSEPTSRPRMLPQDTLQCKRKS